MINKIYEFIKDNIKSIIFLIVFVVVINLKLPFSVYAPGGVIDISKRLNNKTDSSINMTYVNFIEGKVPVLLISLLLPNFDIVSDDDIKYDNEELKDSLVRDKISLEESISNAYLVSYNYLNKNLKIDSTTYYVTYISGDAKTDLKIGDEIISVDGETFTPNIASEYLSKKSVGENVTIKVKNNDKYYERYASLIESEGKTLIGISFAKVNKYDGVLEYKHKNSESGPSGGAMLTLALINELSDKKLFGDKKVCGTGTISEDGSIGEIGGVKYKILGASKNKCDYFITPKENYDEALKVKNKNNLKIEVVEAENISSLIEKLSS